MASFQGPGVGIEGGPLFNRNYKHYYGNNNVLDLLQTFYEEGPESLAASGEAGSRGSGVVSGVESGGLGVEAEGDSSRVFPMGKLTDIVGSDKPQLCKTLIHLVMADSAYVESTNKGIGSS